MSDAEYEIRDLETFQSDMVYRPPSEDAVYEKDVDLTRREQKGSLYKLSKEHQPPLLDIHDSNGLPDVPELLDYYKK